MGRGARSLTKKILFFRDENILHTSDIFYVIILITILIRA